MQGLLAMTMVVRDEEDILDANLAYHRALGVDVILVIDHGSIDATPKILERHARSGTVCWWREEERAHVHADRVSRLLAIARDEHDAARVIHADADEFWMPLAGFLREVFGAIPESYGWLLAPRHDFPPAGLERGPFHERIVYRSRRSLNLRGTRLKPKVAQRPATAMRYTARARRVYYRFRRGPRSPRRPALNESNEEGMATATRIERTYDAPIETIWELWTTPSGIEAWWAPDGFTTEVQTLDLVPNGELVYTMTATGPEQVEFMRGAGMPLTIQSRKRFTEIEAPTRLAYSSLADFIPGVDPYEFMTVVELDSVAGGTHVVMRMDALHDDTWTERLIMGRENELDNLATLIARR